MSDIKEVLKQLKLVSKYKNKMLTEDDCFFISGLYPYSCQELIDLFSKEGRLINDVDRKKDTG